METNGRRATISRARKGSRLRREPSGGAAAKMAKKGPAPEELLKRYLHFLVEHRGLGASSRRQNRKALTEFLDFLNREGVVLSALCVTDIDRFFVETMSLGLSKVHFAIRSGSVRSFVRYLFAEGWLHEDLSGWVEGPIVTARALRPVSAHDQWPPEDIELAER